MLLLWVHGKSLSGSSRVKWLSDGFIVIINFGHSSLLCGSGMISCCCRFVQVSWDPSDSAKPNQLLNGYRL